jgi:tetratricopeptide (TPR) repeat protein
MSADKRGIGDPAEMRGIVRVTAITLARHCERARFLQTSVGKAGPVRSWGFQMGGADEKPVLQYSAFLSYSHADAAFASKLHRRLESYRLPKALVDQQETRKAHLAPIFRDRDELPAAADLNEEVRTALAQSGSLVVLCSSSASASYWVRKEIETFRTLAPTRPVLAALVPGATPACLDPLFGALGLEPVAADFNRAADGKRFGLLKLVAGIAGMPLAALIRRDAQRRLRRVIAVTLVAVAGMLTFAAIAAVAVEARRQADRERERAEGLVEFMLTDLRERLEGVGRLDVLGAVNERVLAHYGGQAIETLPPDSIERRARLFHAMGEVEEKRGRLDLALPRWREAHRATAALLARSPDDPKRIFGHAQSEFWLGYAAFARRDLLNAGRSFQAYKRLADHLVAIDPASFAYRQEAAYAEGNICSLLLASKLADKRGAIRSCRAALMQMQAAAIYSPPTKTDQAFADVGNRHAWLADALRQAGDWAAAEAEYRAQEQITKVLLSRDPKNLEHRDTWVVTQFSLAELEAGLGRVGEARDRLKAAAEVIARMRAFDPANAVWAKRAARVAADLEVLSKRGEKL